jgi:hypothetical protein
MKISPITYAFPDSVGARGMTLRDYFAAEIVGGLLANPHTEVKDNDAIRAISDFSYNLADAMLAAREQRGAE